MKFNKKTILLFIFACLAIQAILIAYNHYTGFAVLGSPLAFFVRLIIGTIFSSFYLGLAVFIDSRVISYLNIRIPWKESILKRTLFDSLLITLVGILIGVLFTVIANIFFKYTENITDILIVNSLISVVANIIVVTVYEGILIFRRSIESQLIAERLEKENSQIRFEILKNQINPHFLFNSLNVLSALINKDPKKAQNFIDEFSMFYRYILDVIDKKVVTLKEELDFANSYIYMQKIRFGDAVKIDINIEASLLDCLIPPLSIQTLLENAVKHNRVSGDSPLRISIYNENNYIFVSNNLQIKMSNSSRGIGLENLKKRYSYVSGLIPDFRISGDKYVAKLPLIKSS